MALLTNAARNRRYWLENFYGVNQRAVHKWDTWPSAWIIPSGQGNDPGVTYALRTLTMGDVRFIPLRPHSRRMESTFRLGAWWSR